MDRYFPTAIRLAGAATVFVMVLLGPTWDGPTPFERFVWIGFGVAWNMLLQIQADTTVTRLELKRKERGNP